MGAARYLTRLAMDANEAVLLSHGFGKTDYLDYRRETAYWRLHSNGRCEIGYLARDGEEFVISEAFHTNSVSIDEAGFAFLRHENSDRIRVFRNENRKTWNT